MDQILSGLQRTDMFVYIDDIIIYAIFLKEHQIKFNRLAARLEKAKLQPDKCEFLRKEVNYLGHIVSENGLKPDSKKIQVIKKFPWPQNKKNIKQFLDLARYYRRFIANFSEIAESLTHVLKKEEEFICTEEQDKAFIQLQHSRCGEPMLQYPDFTKPFLIMIEAFDRAIGSH